MFEQDLCHFGSSGAWSALEVDAVVVDSSRF